MPILYYRADHGGVGRIETSDNVTPRLPAGAVEITAEEYEAGSEEMRAAHDAYVEGLRAGERAQAADDLRALLAAGIPESTARRLTSTVGADVEGVEGAA